MSLKRYVSTLLFSLCGLAAGQDVLAVYLNPNGVGQALIFPYYSAQSVGGNPYNTYISIVNRAPSTPTVNRVRFREGRNGREVASFNLYLAPGDTWAAVVIPTQNGARLVTADKSCVNPEMSADGASNLRYLDFTNSAYAGDGLGDSTERTREGYVEVIEMAALTGTSAQAISPPADNSSNAPVNCAAVQGSRVVLETANPLDALSGTLTLINVSKGMDFTVNADSLAQLTSTAFYRDYSDAYPDFNSAEVSPVSLFVSGDKTYRATWNSPVDAVSSVLLKRYVHNEVILDSPTNSGTDWVVTLPMRRFSAAIANPPATYPPSARTGDPVNVLFRPRDGNTLTIVEECGTTCPPLTFPTTPGSPRLYWASTIVSFDHGSTAAASPSTASHVLGSTNALALTLPTSAENGAGSLDLPQQSLSFQGSSTRLSNGATATQTGSLRGTPAIGFMVRTFQNGSVACGGIICQANYGGSFSHIAGAPVLTTSAQ